MWRRRRRRGRRGRLPKSVLTGNLPPTGSFNPKNPSNLQPVSLEIEEIEALRLVDLQGLSQEEAGQKMGVSRGTIWRLVQSARRKTAQALSEGREIQIGIQATEKNLKINDPK